MNNYPFVFLIIFYSFISCQAQPGSNDSQETTPTDIDPVEIAELGQFKQYWYQGQAELNRFKVNQARYGKLHHGEAVMIFVTEDFLVNSQVKKEQATKEQATSVLKLNFVRRFTTGLYDYSLMSSVFTPVKTTQYPSTLKLTTTAQDWCGHVFMQMNLRNNQYRVNSYSYFQSEGDSTYDLPAVWLEDELWTKLRMNPDDLPTGTFKMIPSTMYTRLKHVSDQPAKAEASISDYIGDDFPGENLKAYRVHYPDLNRTLKIYYEAEFPYRVAGWQETYESGWGQSAQTLTTTAVRTNQIKNDYWNHNAVQDSTWRKKLGPSLIQY